mmetsp:Transcript_16185/g.25125  ORF Transcript_16185/g.25125 Transcript_16185/m.25125 type:complete len:250 (-) Transcript_16185:661-1410(-)
MNLAAHHGRVDSLVRRSCMTTFALKLNSKEINRRQKRPLAQRKLTDRQAGIVVHAIDLFDTKPVHHTVFDHCERTVATLFRRLENDCDRSIKIACLTQIFRSAKQHCRVSIMATGMHGTFVFGRIVQPRLLRHRQRIHVSPQANDITFGVSLTFDETHNTRATNASDHLVTAERLKLLSHKRGRAMGLIQHLRMGMDVPTPLCDFSVQFCKTVFNRHVSLPCPCFSLRSAYVARSSLQTNCCPEESLRH